MVCVEVYKYSLEVMYKSLKWSLEYWGVQDELCIYICVYIYTYVYIYILIYTTHVSAGLGWEVGRGNHLTKERGSHVLWLRATRDSSKWF